MQLIELAGTHNRRGNARLRQNPGKGNLRQGAIDFLCHGSQGIKDAPVTIGEHLVPERIGANQPSLTARPRLLALVLASSAAVSTFRRSISAFGC